jgi:type IV/VI secretion system ImpK/VasF family protein
MSGPSHPWFQIASTFSTLQRLCKKARKAEVRASKALRQKARKETDAEPGLLQPPAPGPEGADLVELRARLRASLTRLKTKLSETLSEHELYYALFPLVVYADELAQSATRGRAGAFRPLQRELYELDNGGERFYSSIDTLLKREETSPLLFEVFYLCLNDGFRGQYANAPEKINEYKELLARRIPVKPTSERDVDPGPLASVELVAFPVKYYVAAAVAVLALFLLLHFLSTFETLPAI